MTEKKTKPADAGEAEVQAAFDEANSKGYFGTVPDGPPNEAYSLKSGPDSPSTAEEAAYAARARADSRHDK